MTRIPALSASRASRAFSASLLYFSAGLLLLGLLLQVAPRRQAYHFKPDRPLSDYLPGAGGGWTIQDLPLGPTEYAAEFSQKLLRLDDFVFRHYRKGAVEFAVYCAYWRPGSQSTNEVGIHNPDNCWAGQGWKAEDNRTTRVLDLPAGMTWPGQYRAMERGRDRQHVIFWHVQGGRPTGQAMRRERWFEQARALAGSLWQSTLAMREFEQYFIRISANVPFDVLQREPQFARVLAAIAPFGLEAR